MPNRHRSMIIASKVSPWVLSSHYGTGGSCTSSPGTPIYPFIGNSSGTFTESLHTKEMDDVVTPRFEEVKRKGGIVNNPMVSTEVKTSEEPSSVSIDYMVQRLGCTPTRLYDMNRVLCEGKYPLTATTTLTHLLPSSVDEDRAKDLAITQAWANIGSDEMLALASVAEAEKSVEGLLYILKKVYRIQKGVSNAELKLLKDELKPSELKEVYLNARYNLRPLYYDAKGIYNACYKADKRPRRQTFRASSTGSATDSDEKTITLFNHTPYVVCTGKVKRTASVYFSARAGVLTSVDPVTQDKLFGLDKVVETAWDLLPWSFILDWFANFGALLSAWSPNFGIKPLSSWVVLKKVTTQKLSLWNTDFSVVDANGYYISPTELLWGDAVAEKVTTTYERIPSYARPVYPRMNLRLDSLKLLDLALISTKIGSRQSFRD